jgi:hypothetical protein
MSADPVEFARAWRKNAGYPPGDTVPTLDEVKGYEMANAETTAAILLAEHAGARTLTSTVSTAFYGTALHPVNNRDLPDFVHALVIADCVAPEREREWITQGWTRPEFPCLNLGVPKWLDLFGRVGFITDWDAEEHDGEAPTVPTATTTLYRGVRLTMHPATNQAASRGLAWTDDVDRARWFATRFGDGLVVTADVTPRRVLARFIGRNESEWIVDTRRLRIEQFDVLHT